MGSFPAKYNNPENLQQRVGIFKFLFFFFFFLSLKFLLSVQSILISLSIIFFLLPPLWFVPQVSTFFVCFLR